MTFIQSSESEDNGMSSVTFWVEQKSMCPDPPRFSFTENFNEIHLINIYVYILI